MKYDFRPLANEIGKLRVIANLPYSISSRLIFLFYENRDIFSSLYILLQKEVAERLIAEPGSKGYGILTVLLGVSARVDIMFQIPPKAFYPVPEVFSALTRIHFSEVPPITVLEPSLLTKLVKLSFGGRRKTLRNVLKNASAIGVSPEVISIAAEMAGIDLNRRGETLSPAEFARLADSMVNLQRVEQNSVKHDI